MQASSIMIMAGGTGGHIYPALAVADYLKKQGHAIHWLGTDVGLEARLVPEHGYPLLTIQVSALRGKGWLKKILAPCLVSRAIFQSLCLFIKHKPKAVLGMGGFASGPGGIAAWLLRIPLLLHEQNAIAGLTNKMLKPFANVVMQAFPATFKKTPNVYTTGNPVREAILSVKPPGLRFNERTEKYNLLIVGGSLGAKRLNEIVPLALAELKDEVNLTVRHQSGEKHLDATREKYEESGIDVILSSYIDNMAEAYAWADLVLCRAGAMTIAELSAIGVASILIPFPYAVDDHQTANARYLSDEACALLIQEADLSVEKLSQAIADLCTSRAELLRIANKARTLSRSQATETVASLCLEVACA